MAELTKDIDRELLVFNIGEKMDMSQTLMNHYKTSGSWTDQRKFEYYYGQYMGFKEVLTMLNNI
jgi:hypothetical protein